MEQMRAHCRMLICAALFSFGSLCGALTCFRLSPAAVSRVCNPVCGFFSLRPLLLLPLSAVFGILLLVVASPSILCILLVMMLFVVYGFLGGAFAFCAISFDFHPVLFTVFLLLSYFCLMQIGGFALRRSFLMRRQTASSGLAKPDRVFDAPRIVVAFVVLLLASFAFASLIGSI